MTVMPLQVTVVGGGLAGSEAAWQAAQRGLHVRLFEMRPAHETGAHRTGDLAELVCSNSFGSSLPDRASGVLLGELRRLGSMLVECATETAVPGGAALAVDREGFARRVTQRIQAHPRIELVREEVTSIPDGLTILASGPLTSPALSARLAELTGAEHLYFFDALSPIVEAETVDMAFAYRASRYGKGQEDEGDYLNCPMTHDEYVRFVRELVAAPRIPLREFEAAIAGGVRAGADRFFEGCLPIEILAERGEMALAFGPMRPVGLANPRGGEPPAAVVQLRQDNLVGSLYNLVGFQTNLTYTEQARVFRMIPGLGSARFVRYGQMHRNTFLNAPALLRPTLQLRSREDLLLAGQITGVEGYLGNIATGCLAGWNAARLASGQEPVELPRETMLGSLCHYVTHAEQGSFQPMKANFGILPPARGKSKRERARAHALAALGALESFLGSASDPLRIAT
ncbi:MAG: methylenetetrahydrofolate--tRNA-(uracil(54)-C(5))-methyltransferase (FADH(2)-oxidizing) TrmFO [Anaerolineales bacterium]